jgi:sucrose-6F-phosphate phosphohydrolase
METILLCCDLDRTLIPNGEQPESAQARPLLNRLAGYPKLRLSYVSGRDKRLVQQAISEYHLPQPDFVIGDVGTTLYRIRSNDWQVDTDWQQHIGKDWNGLTRDDIAELLIDHSSRELWLQPPKKQNTYKLSYFTGPKIDSKKLTGDLNTILQANFVSANLIWSRDEAENCGLLDILPASANKLEAICFLMAQEGIEESRTVFAGDSGNDLDALSSGLQAILVKNAAEDVRRQAVAALERNKMGDRLYLARGNLFSLNGNYSSGVIEGLAHFFPEILTWLKQPG